NEYATDVCVRAYDASGNVSGCQPIVLAFPLANEMPLDAPEVFSVSAVNESYFHLEWFEPPVATGYLLRYGPAGCRVPGAVTVADIGPSAVLIDPGFFDIDLAGLTPNQLYWFEIVGLDNNGLPGKPTRRTQMLLDSPDGNGDGLPDAWAAFYGIADPHGDLDLDGLDNLGEYQSRTNPRHADSDGDGFYDGYELEWGTDPCGPEKPPYHTQPRLTLMGLQKYTLRTALNLGTSSSTIDIVNFGAGQMNWQISSDASWLTFDQTSGNEDATVRFTADPAGLAPGAYRATVTVQTIPTAQAGRAVLAEQAQFTVTFMVMPAIVPADDTYRIYLPIARRD
ncbi:MAG: hypothetical protein KDE28_30735, partial [Anaerolineales bacterium]|nr:hypothetical protein [Anaerolineales bacterium]